MSEEKPRRRRAPSLFWPLVLIGAGVIFLLINFGYVEAGSVWPILYRFWPALLILVGIDILFGGRSILGSIISSLLGLVVIGGLIAVIWFAPQIPALRDLQVEDELRTEQVSHPLGDIEQVQATMDSGGAGFVLTALEDSDNLIEAEIQHRGELVFDVRRNAARASIDLDVRRLNPLTWFTASQERWTVGLNPAPRYQIELDTGAGDHELDLNGLDVFELDFDQGSGRTDLTLPSSGDVECVVDMGSGDMTITVPEGMEARIDLDRGSGSVDIDDRFRLIRGRENRDGVWETDGYADAENRAYVEIDMGSGRLSIR